MMEARKIPNTLWAILACGAAARLALLAWSAGLPLWTDDESDYNALALRLAERGVYCDADDRPTSLRPPLYPAFVAAVYWLAGGESHQTVRALQAALSLGTVVLIYSLGTRLYSPRVGLWAAGICCFYPSLLVYNDLLLSEVLFTCLLTGACWSAVRALQSSGIGGFPVTGALLGLGALTRSVIWLSPPFLALFILLFWKASFAKRVCASLTLCMAFAAVVGPWSIRNTRLQKTFTAIDVMGGRNFMMGNYEHTPLHRSWAAISIGGERAWYRALAREHGPLRSMTQGQIDKLAMKVGIAFVRQHPRLTLHRDAIKFLDFWQLEREVLAGASQGRFGSLPRGALLTLAVIILGAYVACVVSAIFGAIIAPPADWRCHLFLMLVTAFVCGLHTLVFGHSRYHLPLMPILTIYSAAAIVNSPQIWKRRANWRFGLACALCLAALAAWGYEVVAADLSAFQDALNSTT